MGITAIFPSPERHDFWARASKVSTDGLLLCGEWATLFVSLGEDCVFGYLDGREIPPEVDSRMTGGMDFWFCIRSSKVTVFLFGSKPKSE